MCRRRGRGAPALLTLLAATLFAPAAGVGQSSTASERRVVDRAERLRQSGRADDARSELADLLARSPVSPDALALLFEIDSESGDLASFLTFAEAATYAAGPDAGRVRELWIDGLSAAGLADSARAVAQRWVERAPADERAVLTLAGTAVGTGDVGEAVEILERAAAGGLDTRAVQLMRADLLVEMGDTDGSVHAWLALLSREDPAIDDVAEGVREAGDSSHALSALLDAAEEAGQGVAPAGLLAMRLGDVEGARRLAAAVIAEERSQFLREYVREADLAGRPGEVAWAANELIVLSPRPVDKMRWRAMVADRSLVAGDTAAARNAFEALTRESEPGGGPHDVATRQLFALLAAEPDRLDEAEDLLGRYGGQYPDSLRAMAEMVGLLAAGHARAGDLKVAEARLAEAREVLGGSPEGVGPLDAAGARIALWTGARDSAMVRMGRALSQEGLPAAERTDRIRMSTVVQVADSAEIAVAGPAALGFHRDPDGFDVSPTLRDLAGLPASTGRPTVLAYLGDVAFAAGRLEVANGLWRRVVEAHPQSPEAPTVILSLARGAEPEGARQWLERLIIGYPESALAPVARRLLAELNEGQR
ncbi:MAG: hypothetical protein OEU54_12855 [Gemmatimonadota bacterium]|nr:hypothetical protein [Gemmatimonadota bacterium]